MRKTLVGVAVGIALGVGIPILVLNGRESEVPVQVPPGFRFPPPSGGERVSLDEAETGFGLPIHRPHDPLASDDLLLQVWFNPQGEDGHGQVAIRYSTGVEEHLRCCLYTLDERIERGQVNPKYGKRRPATTPLETWEKHARALARQTAEHEGGSAGDYLVKVQGMTTFVMPYEPGLHAGYVEFFVADRAIVALFGELDRDTLIRIAKSIR